MKKSNVCFYLVFILFCFSCSTNDHLQPKIGDHRIKVFDDTHLYFDLSLKEDSSLLHKDSIIRLDAGRVLLKKINLPTYEFQPSVIIQMTLQSNGDPWDKSGSLFVVPKSSSISRFMDLESGMMDWKDGDEYPGVIPFQIDSLNYEPNVELLRFMTPFGIGFFNEHEAAKERKPVYIPRWEENVSWTQDITHLLPLLEGEVYIGVFIDTWTKEGYKFSVDLVFEETRNSKSPQKERRSPSFDQYL